MIVFEIVGTENNPIYQALEVSNGQRQYHFLRSIVLASQDMGRPFLSHDIVKALNFHAITCLHTHAGEYRPCAVTVGDFIPVDHYRVMGLMDDFINNINRYWESFDAVALAAQVLWRINRIHPFINGNGRTARAASYFVLCLKLGGWLRGDVILPELLRQNRDEYVAALKEADRTAQSGALNLTVLEDLVSRLLSEQLASVDLELNP